MYPTRESSHKCNPGFACPICYRVVERLHRVLISIGLTDLGERQLCSECLESYESDPDPMLIVIRVDVRTAASERAA